MHFTLDIHCHTVNSTHAYSTITENAAHAASIGLTHIGIADHGPGMPGGAHLYHFANLWVLPDVIGGVRVFKGAEANIMNPDGKLDLSDGILAKMDFVIASMHRVVIKPTDRDTHTQTLINAMDNPHVHILGHPIDISFDIDMTAVVAAAARTGTIIEINEKTLDPGSYRHLDDELTLDLLKLCQQFKVQVLASSDAHFATLVGDFPRAKALIEQSGIDEVLVINTCEKRLMDVVAKKRRR